MKLILYILLVIVQSLLFVRVVLSWLQKEDANEFTKKICALWEPILKPLRSIFSNKRVGIDFSPILIFVIIDIIKRFYF